MGVLLISIGWCDGEALAGASLFVCALRLLDVVPLPVKRTFKCLQTTNTQWENLSQY